MKHQNIENIRSASFQRGGATIQNDSFRDAQRQSYKQIYMVVDKENASQQPYYPQSASKQVRPSSTTTIKQQPQTSNHQVRPYSSSYEKRYSDKTQQVGYLSQLQGSQVPSAPVLKKPLQNEIINRGSYKKEGQQPGSYPLNTTGGGTGGTGSTYLQPNLKNSLMLSQMVQQQQKYYSQQQQFMNSYSGQKVNRFFSNKPETGVGIPNNSFLVKNDDRQHLYQSVPNEPSNKLIQIFMKGTSKGNSTPQVYSFIDKPQDSIQRKTETEGPAPESLKRTQDYQEYRKLQDKLQYLENKIISIKSNIDNNNQALINKNSSRILNKKDINKPKGLTAKFFGGGNNNISTHEENKKNKPADKSVQIIEQQKLHESTQLSKTQKAKHKVDQSSPSLSQFITQVKPGQNIPIVSPQQQTDQKRRDSNLPSTTTITNAIKNILNKPSIVEENVKNSNIFQQQNTKIKKSFTRKSSQQELQKYGSVTNLLKDNRPQEPPFLYYISYLIKAYMSTESTKLIDQAREHLIQTLQAMQFAKTMRQTPQNIIDEKKYFLPKKEYYRNKKTLVFDLDETLIHCNENAQIPGDVYLPIRFPTGELIEASVNIRPYAQQTLELLSKHFEIIVFTASHSCYANVVLDYLDPTKQWISHRLFRESCVQTEEGAYIKDLRVLANRNLCDLLLIDNAAYSFGLQIANGVPIIPFYESKQDQELIHLQNYLLLFRNCRDMRDINTQMLKLDRYADFNDPIDFLQNLFRQNIPTTQQ